MDQAAFLTDPRFEDISEGSVTQKLRLMSELVVRSKVLGFSLCVPAGFEFEESIPNVLFTISRPRGESKRAACVHDWIYRNGGKLSEGTVTRQQADAVYHELLRLKGVSPVRSYFRWFGVRLGGSSSWK